MFLRTRRSTSKKKNPDAEPSKKKQTHTFFQIMDTKHPKPANKVLFPKEIWEAIKAFLFHFHPQALLWQKEFRHYLAHTIESTNARRLPISAKQHGKTLLKLQDELISHIAKHTPFIPFEERFQGFPETPICPASRFVLIKLSEKIPVGAIMRFTRSIQGQRVTITTKCFTSRARFCGVKFESEPLLESTSPANSEPLLRCDDDWKSAQPGELEFFVSGEIDIHPPNAENYEEVRECVEHIREILEPNWYVSRSVHKLADRDHVLHLVCCAPSRRKFVQFIPCETCGSPLLCVWSSSFNSTAKCVRLNQVTNLDDCCRISLGSLVNAN